jgi:hypothetical protein
MSLGREVAIRTGKEIDEVVDELKEAHAAEIGELNDYFTTSMDSQRRAYETRTCVMASFTTL